MKLFCLSQLAKVTMVESRASSAAKMPNSEPPCDDEHVGAGEPLQRCCFICDEELRQDAAALHPFRSSKTSGSPVPSVIISRTA